MRKFFCKNSGARCLYILLGLAFFIALLFRYGFIPWFYGNSFLIVQGETASVQCLLNHGFASFFSYCQNTGQPLGLPFLSDLPINYLGFLFAKLFFLDPYLAALLSRISVLLIAYLSCIYLLKRLGVHSWIALIMSFAYLTLPVIPGHAGFGSLMYGLMLIPFFLLADLWYAKRIQKGATLPMIVIPTFFYTAVRSLALFINGYAFVISLLGSFAVFGWFLWENRHHWKKILIYVVGFFAANAVTNYLYNLYVPGGDSYSVMPLDFFRAQGIDIISFVLPPVGLFFSDLFRIGTEWNAFAFFGDGTNVRFNYLGYSLLLPFFLYLFFCKKNLVLKLLIVMGFVGLILSLGPSLKVNDTREAVIKNTVSFSDYLMKPEMATLELPTQSLYTDVAGIKNMRSVYRWHVFFKFVLIVAVAMFFSGLLKQRRYSALALFLILIVFEFMPNVSDMHQRYRTAYGQFELFREDIVEDMQPSVKANDKVFFLSRENDFLVGYISGSLNLLTYNAAGDKLREILNKRWPQAISNMRNNVGSVNDNAYTAFSTGIIDTMIIPYFNLRWHAYYWPPSEKERQEILNEKKLMFDYQDNRFRVEDHKWFSIVTLRR